jgi:hypothetical protein
VLGFRRYKEEIDLIKYIIRSLPIKSIKGTRSLNTLIKVSDSEGDSNISPRSIIVENEFRKSRLN